MAQGAAYLMALKQGARPATPTQSNSAEASSGPPANVGERFAGA